MLLTPKPVTAAILAAVVVALVGAPAAAEDRTAAPAPAAPRASVPIDAQLCTEGTVRDDGTAETGYGWVPSVVDGIYVQRFESSELGGRALEQVCACWLRTRSDNEIDFEVVGYRDAEDRPEAEPFFSLPARASAVPQGIVGRLFCLPTPGIELPSEEPVYLGVRWNPSVDTFFFTCADSSAATEPTDVFFRDDRAGDWASALETLDPIFQNHRAIFVRAVARARTIDVPGLDSVGRATLAIALATLGLAWIRRRF